MLLTGRRFARRAVIVVAASCWSLSSVAAWAQTTVDPKAAEVLKKLCDYGQSLKVAKSEVTLALSVKSGAKVSKINVIYVVGVATPNRVVIRPKPLGGAAAASAEMAPSLVSDGSQLLISAPTEGKYVLDAGPATFDDLAKIKHLDHIGLSHPLVATALLGFRGDAAVTQELTGAEYLGEDKVGAVKCHHLKLAFKLYDAEVWIDTTEKPTLRKAQPDLTRWAATNKDLPPAEMKPEVQITYKPWITTGLAKADDFKIVAPTGLTRVDAFDAPSATAAVHPLLDRPAPPFQLRLLQGGTANLAAHKGKQVVVLDFWATWCGPCVRSLPEIISVAAEFESKGVAFYAVNLNEDADTITAFLTAQKLRMPVAMDTGSSVAGQYGVRAIPQTLIIDREGVVKVAHIGAGANIRQQLTQDLNQVLSAK